MSKDKLELTGPFTCAYKAVCTMGNTPQCEHIAFCLQIMYTSKSVYILKGCLVKIRSIKEFMKYKGIYGAVLQAALYEPQNRENIVSNLT